jgi:hypothetical protein
VHWTRRDRGHAVFGEIDRVIVTPSARIVLIEQKSGFLSETAGALIKNYEGKERRVSAQLDRTCEALRQRLAPVAQGEPVAIDYFLYCPDYTVKQPGTAGLPPECLVDARGRAQWCTRRRSAMPNESPRDILAHKLRHFFENELPLVADVGALLGHAERLVTRSIFAQDNGRDMLRKGARDRPAIRVIVFFAPIGAFGSKQTLRHNDLQIPAQSRRATGRTC